MSHNSDTTPRQKEITALAAAVVDLTGSLWGMGMLALDDDDTPELLDIVNRMERKMAAQIKPEESSE